MGFSVYLLRQPNKSFPSNPYERTIFYETAVRLLGGRVVRADPHARAIPHLLRPIHMLILENRLYQRRGGASEVT